MIGLEAAEIAIKEFSEEQNIKFSEEEISSIEGKKFTVSLSLDRQKYLLKS